MVSARREPLPWFRGRDSFPLLSRRRHPSLPGATADNRLGADVAADGRAGADEHAQYIARGSGKRQKSIKQISTLRDDAVKMSFNEFP